MKEVLIAFFAGGVNHHFPLTAEAEPTEVAPGLWMHRSIVGAPGKNGDPPWYDDGDRWTLTHEASGMSAGGPTGKEAILARAAVIGPLLDWTMSEDAMMGLCAYPDKAMKKVQKSVRETATGT